MIFVTNKKQCSCELEKYCNGICFNFVESAEENFIRILFKKVKELEKRIKDLEET